MQDTKTNAARGDEIVSEAATALNLSELATRLHFAAGVPGGAASIYDEPLPTLAALGKAFGVSERSAQTWIASGAPGESGRYFASQVGFWRRSRPDGGNRPGEKALPTRAATGELFRGACRYFAGEIKRRSMEAADEFGRFCREKTNLTPKQCELLTTAYECAIIAKLQPLVLDEQTIENTLAECWRLT